MNVYGRIRGDVIDLANFLVSLAGVVFPRRFFFAFALRKDSGWIAGKTIGISSRAWGSQSLENSAAVAISPQKHSQDDAQQ